jgi:S1-C subfamily serine protease
VRVFNDDRVELPSDTGEEPTPLPRRSSGRPLKPWLTGGGIAIAIVLGVVAVARSGQDPAKPVNIAQTVSSEVAQGIAAAQKATPPAGETVYRAIQPSVVLINATHGTGASADTDSGAGVVINANGQILTARHVIDGADSIQVTFPDGTNSTATVVSEEASDDIAVIAPDTPPSVIVPAVMGGRLQIGDVVYALGHPLGLTDSLSSGVVSGLNRTVPISDQLTLDGLIQFDAAVNPGNSGGPLLNSAGQVVGIVTALANPADQTFFVGIGFAIPIATAGGAAGAPQQ